MKNNPNYIALKELTVGYSDEQIISATKQQAATLAGVGINTFSDAFFDNMKRKLCNEREVIANEVIKNSLRSQAESWLQANFPDADFEIDENRVVTIYLDGKS